MDEDRLRELMRSPLDDAAERQTRWWLRPLIGTVAAAAVFGAIAVALLGGGEPPSAPALPGDATSEPAATGGTAGAAGTVTVPGVAGYPESEAFNQLVYDPATERTIAVAGTAMIPGNPNRSGEPVTGTWAYEAATGTWYRYPGAPTPRAGYASAWDGATGRVVLFGGTASPLRVCGVFGPCAVESLGDTWLLDPTTGIWREAAPGVAPSARYGAAMAYDEQSGLLVLFGGATMSERTFSNDPLADTWVYDAAANTWTELEPATAPPARAWHRMVYDPGSDRILLFGGSGGGDLDGRVWAYDADANGWEPSAAAGPVGRWTPVTAFDTESGLFVVVGGQGPLIRAVAEGVTATDIAWHGDVWVYDPAIDVWAELDPLPGGIAWSSGAYDPGTDRVISLFQSTTATLDANTGEWTFTEAPGEN